MKKSIIGLLLLIFTIFSNAKTLEKEGWNLMAVCQDMSMNDIDMTGLIEVQSQDGEAIYSGEDFEFSDLTELRAGYGYWVNGSLGSSFTTGEATAKIVNSLPKEGWNLMAVCEDKSANDINLTGLIEIQSQDGYALYSGEDFEFSDLTELTFGTGYWVNGTEGTEFISKDGVSIPSAYLYPTLNASGEVVTSTFDDYTIKLYADEEVTVNAQSKHIKVTAYVNSEVQPFFNIMEGYIEKNIIAGLYDSTDKLVAISEVVSIESTGVTKVYLEYDDLNNSDENNSTEEDFALSDVQNQSFYTVTLRNGVVSKGKVDFFNDTRTFYFYNEDNNSYYEKDTVTYSLDGVDIHVSSQILNQEFNFNKVPKDGSPAIFVADIILEDDSYFGTRHFFSSESEADEYMVSLLLESYVSGQSVYFTTSTDVLGVRTYNSDDNTYTGQLTLSSGYVLDVTGTYSIDGSVITLNRTSPSTITTLLTYTGEIDGGFGFDVNVSGTISDSVSFTSAEARDAYVSSLNESSDTQLTAAMRVLESMNLETDDISIALTEARELLESADASDKDAQVGLALFALAEITNSSEVSDLIDVNLEGTYDYADNLPKILSADDNLTLDLIENLTTFSEISTTVLHNTAEQLVVIASAFEDAFSDASYVFTYDDINITANQSLAIRSGILAVASQLEYVASFRNVTAEDIKPREVNSVEYSNLSSNPVAVLNRTDVGSLENAERLGNAKTLLLSSIALLSALDASEEDSDMQEGIIEAQARALEVNASLHGISSFVIENTNHADNIEKVYLNLSAMYEEASVLDMTHTLGHDFSYESRDEYFSNQEYRTGEYNLSISREYNEPMSAVWISQENGTDLPYIEYQMPRPSLEVVPTIPTGSDSHIPLVVTKVEVIENDETVNYTGDDLLRYFFNYIDLFSENQHYHYQRSEDINITFSADSESMIAYDGTPTYTFEFNGPSWMHLIEINSTTARVIADAGQSGFVSYSINVTDNFGHSEERWYSIYVETPNATIELSENNFAVNQDDTKIVTLTTEYVSGLHLTDAPDFVTLNGNEISINPTSQTAITHYEIVIEGTNSINNGIVNEFLQIDVIEAINSSVILPDGYDYRVINNSGTELENEITIAGTLYTVKLYSNQLIVQNDQSNHVGVFATINSVQSGFQIQNSYTNVVLAIYDETDTLVAVSEETVISGNTGISANF